MIKIICDGAGMARAENPHLRSLPKEPGNGDTTTYPNPEWRRFEKNNPPLQVYHNSTLFMEKGEAFGDVVHQEHLPFFKEDEWMDCEVTDTEILQTPGAIYRTIYRITSSVTAMGGEERELDKAGMQPFERFPNLADQLQYAATHWSVDMGTWNELLSEINNVCSRLLELENINPNSYQNTGTPHQNQ